jgi:hypothetical protein
MICPTVGYQETSQNMRLDVLSNLTNGNIVLTSLREEYAHPY